MTTSKYKAPRLIQSRSPKFNIQYGRYIKPLEKRINKNFDFIGKGNYDTVAAKIHHKSLKYKYYTEGDHSTFDAHVTVAMLKLTHKFYSKNYPGDKIIRQLSRKTIYNKCRTRDNISYFMKGTRMSGDVDTSFGNSLINYAILSELLLIMDMVGDIIVQGDDFILFTNDPIDINLAAQHLLTFNMETKFKPSTTNIHKVEFCKTKMVYNQGQITMHADIKRQLLRLGMTDTNPKDYQLYLLELLYCFMCVNRNTTIDISRTYKKCFELYRKRNKMDTEVLKKKIKKIKNVGRDQRWVFQHQKNNKPLTTNDCDFTTINAYPELITDVPNILYVLDKRLLFLFRLSKIRLHRTLPYDDTLVISHQTETVTWLHA